MKVDSNLVFQIEDFVPKGRKVTFGKLVKKFSEETSLCSNPDGLPNQLWMKVSVERPSEAIAALLVISYLRIGTRSHFFIENILEHIFRMAKNYKFEGKWNRVGQSLSRQDFESLGIYGFLESIQEYYSENDFFGNLLPVAYFFLERNIFIVKTFYKPYRKSSIFDDRPVKRKVRRRGYDDKGSRRPDHKWLPKYDLWLEEEEQERKKRIPSYHRKDPPIFTWWKGFS